jgi:hypothetical protein
MGPRGEVDDQCVASQHVERRRPVNKVVDFDLVPRALSKRALAPVILDLADAPEAKRLKLQERATR